MAALKNQRQELYCQLLKRRIPPFRAYPMAGYSGNSGSPYRLQDNARVKARLAELDRTIAMKTRVTVETITADLDRIMAGAEAAEQFGAAKGAVDSKAKLHGLMVDRQERGEPGAFADSSETVLARVAAELGDDAAAALAKALERVPGADAAIESDVPLPPASTNDGTDTLN